MGTKEKSQYFDIPAIIQEKWQNIINIMAQIINVPAGLIMRIVDSDITVFLSSKTDNNPYKPGEKGHLENSGLYCETVIKTRDKLLVPNAPADEKWKNNPDIKLNMISYLGFPIVLPDDTAFGTICVLDNKENAYSRLYIDLVKNFREIIEADLSMLFMNHALGEKNRQLIDYIAEINLLRGVLPICASCKKIRDDSGYWNRIEEYFEKYSDVRFSHSLCQECAKKLYGTEEWYEGKI
ncbi:MAG: GAF domain-containing protein [Spirochaetales bacterium]|nr:GAF domain-containing protein [Spirochaetales bacterium]